MNGIYLLLGTNLGDRLHNLKLAAQHLEDRKIHIMRNSAVYESPSWGKEGLPDYLNQIVMVQTGYTPGQLLHEILAVEEEMGRVRSFKNASRIIDIDILYYYDKIINEAGLVVPHPRLHMRRFTLVPLDELAPHEKHPLLYLTTRQLLDQCEDEGDVRKFQPPPYHG